MQQLGDRTYRNAVVYPTTRREEQPGKLLMGVFDHGRNYVPGSAADRTIGETGAEVDPDIYGPPEDAECAEAIYAGVIYNHFGHFLVESLARAWFFTERPEATIVWAGGHDPRTPVDSPASNTRLRPWQRQLLDVLGIRNPVMIVKYPMRFRRLHVPDIGYRYADRFVPQHAAALARYEGPAQRAGERLWLSRSKTGLAGRGTTMVAAERRLAAAGWRVEYPEQLTIAEQLDALSAAEVIAGEEGSAFHLLMLLASVEGKRFEMIRRQGPEHPNMHTIGDVRGADQTFHSLQNEEVVSAEGRSVATLTPNAAELLDALSVPVLPLAKTPELGLAEAASVEFAERARAERVLVVGTGDPAEVRALSSRVRVSVSEDHDGDPRAYASEGITIYDVDAATYANHFHADASVFDVILIHADSLDEYEHLFNVSISMLANGGVCVLIGEPEVVHEAAVSLADSPGRSLGEALVPGAWPIMVRQQGRPDARLLSGTGSRLWAAAGTPGKQMLRMLPALRPMAHRLKGWLSSR